MRCESRQNKEPELSKELQNSTVVQQQCLFFMYNALRFPESRPSPLTPLTRHRMPINIVDVPSGSPCVVSKVPTQYTHADSNGATKRYATPTTKNYRECSANHSAGQQRQQRRRRRQQPITPYVRLQHPRCMQCFQARTPYHKVKKIYMLLMYCTVRPT